VQLALGLPARMGLARRKAGSQEEGGRWAARWAPRPSREGEIKETPFFITKLVCKTISNLF
jgi:hypothetical protein